jgi:fumarate hydratase class II
MGNDHCVTLAVAAGQRVNVMPIIAYNLFQSMDVLINGVSAFSDKVTGIVANHEKVAGWLAKSAVLVTALNLTLPAAAEEQGSHGAQRAHPSGRAKRLHDRRGP